MMLTNRILVMLTPDCDMDFRNTVSLNRFQFNLICFVSFKYNAGDKFVCNEAMVFSSL